MKVAVIGQGYVGLSLAMAASSHFDEIIGFDINDKLVSRLNNKVSHIEGISNEILSSTINYRATSNIRDIEEVDIVILAVPTPLTIDRKPDLSYLIAACKEVAKALKKSALIINESTSFPGTLRELIQPIFEENSEVKHEFAVSPERVDPGNLMWNQQNTPRLVAGLTTESTQQAIDFYSKFCMHVVQVSTPEVAEAAKLFENTFRQVNIAMVNELAQISFGLNIDVREVLNAAATKPFGFMKFNPSLGVGGHCIPVDPSYLSFAAENVGIAASFIDLANQINLEMPSYVANRISQELDGLDNRKVVVVGISYKANVSDLRESPSILLIDALETLGAKVSWHDPLIENWNGSESVDLAKTQFDAAVFATAHSVIDLEKLRSCAPYVFDCTGTLSDVNSL